MNRVCQVRPDGVDRRIVHEALSEDRIGEERIVQVLRKEPDRSFEIGRIRVEEARYVVAVSIDRLAAELQARNKIVMEGTGVEPQVQLGLIGINPCYLV